MEEPGADHATRLLDHRLAAPDLLAAECANVLWKKVMRAELAADEAEAMAVALATVEIELHPTRDRLGAALALACVLRRPAYDCLYLCLAEELAPPLLTADERLVKAVRAAPSRRFAELVILLSELPQILAKDGLPGS